MEITFDAIIIITLLNKINDAKQHNIYSLRQIALSLSPYIPLDDLVIPNTIIMHQL